LNYWDFHVNFCIVLFVFNIFDFPILSISLLTFIFYTLVRICNWSLKHFYDGYSETLSLFHVWFYSILCDHQYWYQLVISHSSDILVLSFFLRKTIWVFLTGISLVFWSLCILFVSFHFNRSWCNLALACRHRLTFLGMVRWQLIF
jgi:hypothetical protein